MNNISEKSGIYQLLNRETQYIISKKYQPNRKTGTLKLLVNKFGKTSFNSNQIQIIKMLGGRYDANCDIWFIYADVETECLEKPQQQIIKPQQTEKPRIVKTEKCELCDSKIYFIDEKHYRPNKTIYHITKELDHNCDGGESKFIDAMERANKEYWDNNSIENSPRVYVCADGHTEYD